MLRINVIGTTSSGKTTFARELAKNLGVPHFELDAYHWAPNWTEVPNEIFRPQVNGIAQGEAWVMDGNYSIARDIIWPRVDTVIWLTRRIIRRGLLREKLWNDNVENPLKHFFTKDSLYLWLVRSHWRHPAKFSVCHKDSIVASI